MSHNDSSVELLTGLRSILTIQHEALRIAVVRAIVHDEVVYQTKDVEGATKALSYIDVPEAKKVRITDNFAHIVGHNPKAIIQEGRKPTKRDSVRWKRLSQ